MNNKALIGLVVLILVIVGVFMTMKNQPPTKAPEATQPAATGEEKVMSNEVTVNVTSLGFEPSSVKVKVGAKVTWVNKSGAVANVSSAKHPTHLVYPPLNLGDFEDGKSVSLVFDKPGTYKYHNHLDPSQVGEVVAEQKN